MKRTNTILAFLIGISILTMTACQKDTFNRQPKQDNTIVNVSKLTQAQNAASVIVCPSTLTAADLVGRWGGYYDEARTNPLSSLVYFYAAGFDLKATGKSSGLAASFDNNGNATWVPGPNPQNVATSDWVLDAASGTISFPNNSNRYFPVGSDTYTITNYTGTSMVLSINVFGATQTFYMKRL